MLVSGTMLKNAVENYRAHSPGGRGYVHNREHYMHHHRRHYHPGRRGTGAAFAVFNLAVAFLFFMMELIVLFYAINMAINCTKGGPERIVNVVLAITFTIPYVMLNILFNPCAKKILQGKMHMTKSK